MHVRFTGFYITAVCYNKRVQCSLKAFICFHARTMYMYCTCLEDQWWLIVLVVQKCKHNTPFVNISKTVTLTKEIAAYKARFIFLEQFCSNFFFFLLCCVKYFGSYPRVTWSKSPSSLCKVIVVQCTVYAVQWATRSQWKLTWHDNFFFFFFVKVFRMKFF
jgi:hypothetical protein